MDSNIGQEVVLQEILVAGAVPDQRAMPSALPAAPATLAHEASQPVGASQHEAGCNLPRTSQRQPEGVKQSTATTRHWIGANGSAQPVESPAPAAPPHPAGARLQANGTAFPGFPDSARHPLQSDVDLRALARRASRSFTDDAMPGPAGGAGGVQRPKPLRIPSPSLDRSSGSTYATASPSSMQDSLTPQRQPTVVQGRPVYKDPSALDLINLGSQLPRLNSAHDRHWDAASSGLHTARKGLVEVGLADIPAQPHGSPHTLALADCQPAQRASVLHAAAAGDLHVSNLPASLPPGGVTPRGAAGSPARGGGGGATPRQPRGSPAKGVAKAVVPSESQYDTDIGEDLREPSFWRAIFRWQFILSFVVTMALAVTATFMLVYHKESRVVYFAWWRWLYFLSGIIPVYWASWIIINLLVKSIEYQFFLTKRVLYFTVATRKPLARLIRALLLLPLYFGCFGGRASDTNDTVFTVYQTLGRILGCIVLFCFANVLKTLIAKLLSTYFHKETYFAQMEDALRKEYFIMALCQPRQVARIDEVLEEQAATEERERRARTLRHGGASNDSWLRQRKRKTVFGSFGQLLSQLPKLSSALPMVRSKSADVASTPADGDGEDANDSAHGRADKRSNAPSSPSSVLGTPQADQLWRASNGTSFKRSVTSARSQPVGTGASASPLSRASGPSRPSQAGAASSAPDRMRRSPGVKKRDAGPPQLPPRNAKDDGEVVAKLRQVEKHIRKNNLQVTFADQIHSAAKGAGAAKGGDQVESLDEAKRLSFFLFWNIKPYFDRSYILPSDLEHFLAPGQAAEAFAMLDVDKDGRVTLHNVRDAVVAIYKERRHLAQSLKDSKSVIGTLERFIAFVVHILMFIPYLLIFQVDVNRVWLTFSSVILAFSFIFGNTIRNMYESVIFLFVVHPFDVGDVIRVEEVDYRVEELSLVSSVLIKLDGARTYYPNVKLNALPLINLSRSDAAGDSIKVAVDMDTPLAVFEVVRAAAQAHLDANATDFKPESLSVLNGPCPDPLKMTMTVGYSFTFCAEEGGRAAKARHGLMAVVAETLTRAGVQYSQAPTRDYADQKNQARLVRKAGAGAAPASAGALPAAPELVQRHAAMKKEE